MDKYEQIEMDEENGFVKCDKSCKAKENPQTLQEYKATLEHYKKHRLYSGCSHGH